MDRLAAHRANDSALDAPHSLHDAPKPALTIRAIRTLATGASAHEEKPDRIR
jgi:hypothetical protein